MSAENLTHVYGAFSNIDLTNIPPTSNLRSISYAEFNINWNASGYRLPTEAEWEYAARGGHMSPGNFTYAGHNDANPVAWFNTNSAGRTHPVGEKLPNALGLYDMNGNVSEWCWDPLSSYSGRPNPGIDTGRTPSGAYVPDALIQRIRRGGGWSNTVANVRSVVRNSDTPSTAHWAIGIRVVRGVSEIY
jgi:formylglycine-generating enzyme required for sulfatase activity